MWTWSGDIAYDWNFLNTELLVDSSGIQKMHYRQNETIHYSCEMTDAAVEAHGIDQEVLLCFNRDYGPVECSKIISASKLEHDESKP